MVLGVIGAHVVLINAGLLVLNNDIAVLVLHAAAVRIVWVWILLLVGLLTVAGALYVVELLRCSVHAFLRSGLFTGARVIQVCSFGLRKRVCLESILGFASGCCPVVRLAAGIVFEKIRTLVMHVVILLLQHRVVRRINALESSADVEVPLVALILQPLS